MKRNIYSDPIKPAFTKKEIDKMAKEREKKSTKTKASNKKK